MGHRNVTNRLWEEDIRGVGEDLPPELLEARTTIDNIDAALIHVLAERFRCTQRVGHIKARYDMPPEDPAREQRQVRRMRALAENAGLDPDFAEKFLSFMVTEVIRHHEDIKEGYRRGEHDGTIEGRSR